MLKDLFLFIDMEILFSTSLYGEIEMSGTKRIVQIIKRNEEKVK